MDFTEIVKCARKVQTVPRSKVMQSQKDVLWPSGGPNTCLFVCLFVWVFGAGGGGVVLGHNRDGALIAVEDHIKA